MLLVHDYWVPWRETKFKQAAKFGNALRGLFLHNEMVQPRRSALGHGRRNDAQTPIASTNLSTSFSSSSF
jgi:hypothetical protein